jgi:hypothetical protein
MIGYGLVNAEQKAIIDAANTPGFAPAGTPLKQRIAAATKLFKQLKEKEGQMTGARKLACDYIRPLIKSSPFIVIDVCCGDAWPKQEFGLDGKLGGHYIGLDVKDGADITTYDQLNPCFPYSPDLILSIYGLQHLLSEEARVWTLLRRIAKPETKFVYVGRYSSSPRREVDRQDPLNAHSIHSLEGLALSSGWRITEHETYRYDGDSYRTDDYPIMGSRVDTNAFCATLEPI